MTLQECYAALGGDYEDAKGRLRSDRLGQKFVLKGMCQNLGFTQLQESSTQLTEALRDGWTPEAAPLVEQVKADYQKTAEAIRAFESSLEA